MDIMFDRLMLMELRENVAKLDAKAYAELKAYNSPPEIVLHILRATLAIFYIDLADEGEFDDWTKVKSVSLFPPSPSCDLRGSLGITNQLSIYLSPPSFIPTPLCVAYTLSVFKIFFLQLTLFHIFRLWEIRAALPG